MNNISKKRLGDIVNFKRGYDLPFSKRNEGTYPIISSSGTSGTHSEFKCDGEGLITGRYGTLGKMYYINGKYWPHNTTLYATDFYLNNPKYVYYLLKCLGNLKTSDKSTVPGINRNDLHEILIPYIKQKQHQSNIAGTLSSLDAKIELNNRINAELEAMAKTLYNYWFVQFDFSDKNGKPYKSSGGKMIYSEELKREIPEGWIAGELSAIMDLVRGVSYNKEDIKNPNNCNLIPILRATNITGNKIDFDNMVYVPSDFVNLKQVLNKYDILITMSSGSKEHIGKNGFFYFDREVAFGAFGAFCAKLVAKQNFQFYLYSYTQSEFMFATIKNECLGTNINNLNGTLVKSFKVVIPPDSIIEKYNRNVKAIFEKIGNNQIQNQQLATLRDWLLPMLMNGQVAFKNAENKVEMAVAAEPVVEYGNKNVIQFSERICTRSERALLAGHIINSVNNQKFGRTKLQKLLHLTEYHYQINLGSNYIKKTAGPHDGKMIEDIESTLKRLRYYSIKKVEGKVCYKGLGSESELDNLFRENFAKEETEINQFISMFQQASFDKCEIVSTLYAVWNNRIIKEQLITNELLKHDFLNWDKQKAKYKDRLDDALVWMREKEIIPNGWGKVIEKETKL